MRGSSQEDGAKSLLVVPSNRTRSSGHRLEHRNFYLNMRKYFFTVRIAEHWNRLPTKDMEFPSLKILKTCLDTFLCNLL